jgi:hypothetical protein
MHVPLKTTETLLTLTFDLIDRISQCNAILMSNRTSPISHDPGYYAVILDVLYQLYCLVNTIHISSKTSLY